MAGCHKLAERIDIANISTISDYAYFNGLVYSLVRDVFRFDTDKCSNQLYLENNVRSMKLIKKKNESTEGVSWEKAYKTIKYYGKEYDRIIGKFFLDTVCKLDMMFHVDSGKTYNPFGDEIELDNDDFFEEDKNREPLSEQNREQEKETSNQGGYDSFTSPEVRAEHVGSGNNTKRQVSHKMVKRIEDRYVQSYISNIPALINSD